MDAAANTINDLTFGERLRLVRSRRRLTLEAAAEAARQQLPSWVPMSREIVRRLEAGLIPEDAANQLQVLALARVYSVEPADLTRTDHDGFAKLRVLIGGAGPTDPSDEDAASTGDQGDSGYPGNPRIAAPEAA